MKKTILTFGLISGVILSVMMAATLPFIDTIGFDKGEVIGYTSMVLAFLLIFFGIRSYRDSAGGGTISFGRAFAIGMLIAAVASVCYTATWEVIYYKLMPDFGSKYSQYQVDRARSDGKSEAEIVKVRAEWEKFAELYKNPFINAGYTFLEPLPAAFVVTLVSAGVLSRKRRRRDSVLASA